MVFGRLPGATPAAPLREARRRDNSASSGLHGSSHLARGRLSLKTSPEAETSAKTSGVGQSGAAGRRASTQSSLFGLLPRLNCNVDGQSQKAQSAREHPLVQKRFELGSDNVMHRRAPRAITDQEPEQRIWPRLAHHTPSTESKDTPWQRARRQVRRTWREDRGLQQGGLRTSNRSLELRTSREPASRGHAMVHKWCNSHTLYSTAPHVPRKSRLV